MPEKDIVHLKNSVEVNETSVELLFSFQKLVYFKEKNQQKKLVISRKINKKAIGVTPIAGSPTSVLLISRDSLNFAPGAAKIA
ncbi:hypothetical protein [Metabacillus arenae]|uniref:Uncharacterized protein n=1 Tax=Metabacillus arenae TaxID=2771434 RepID=A0A926NEG0_9BACI|nr:hypothetical protein [Metabacillus arenae]MBD1379736.1 hypothetical protein [Metabacillus arenae]